MSYYRRLNLPKNPVKKVPNFVAAYDGQVVADPYEELTDEFLDILSRLNLTPNVLFFFCKGDKESNLESRVLHSDITRADPHPWYPSDEPSKKTWKDIICGLNWEMSGSKTEFIFYDTTHLEGLYPVRKDLPLKYDYLNSVHYVKRSNFGIPEGAVRLDTVLLNEIPTMVRTETPHITAYSGDNIRVGASLRFKEDWTTWEEALERFRPLIIE